MIVSRRRALGMMGTASALAATAAVSVQCAPTPAPAATPDPLLALVNEYQAGLAIFNASDLNATTEEDDALAAVTWHPPYYRLCDDPPAPTTMAGAIAGIRLVADEEDHCGSQPTLTINVLRVVLAYLEGATA